MKTNSPGVPEGSRTLDQISKLLMELISTVPSSNEGKSPCPEELARDLAKEAALQAAVVSGGLALPPGPLGFVTILPDLVVVWNIQRQMVANIAAAFGKTRSLGREQMIWCLFRHVASHVVTDLGMQVGERVLFRRASLKIVQGILRRVGIKMTQRVAGKSIARIFPGVGSTLVAAYAFWDTLQVAETTIKLFRAEIVIDPTPPDAALQDSKSGVVVVGA